MYPTPIQDSPLPVRVGYRLVLYIAIALWIAPLIAIVMTAIRAQSDLLAGNYWGMPQQFTLIQNFREIFVSSPMGMFFFNSIVVTVTTVVGVLVLSTLAAVALAKYPCGADARLLHVHCR